MITEQRDITPTLALIEGLASDDWDVRGAISELVDNSLGEGRGNASRVDIRWDQKTRELTVLDNGQGMKDVGDLFQLGKGVGRHPKDIGKYGMGGTMAIVWLGVEVDVWTKRGNQMSSAHVAWGQLKDWRIPQQGWQRASLANTPSELLAETQGTLIRLLVPRSKKFHADTVQRELAKRYAPGLRAGRRIRWTTVTTRGDERVDELAAPRGLPQPIHIDLVVVVGTADLPVQGSIGLDPDLSPEDSRVDIGFGARVVRGTKDCYSSPDGEQSYSGVGVAGYIDLGEGWQDFLTSTKTDFKDIRVYDALMAALFERLEPLLKESERRGETLQLETIALRLAVSLEGAFEIDVAAAPRAPEPQYRWTRTGEGVPVPPIEVKREPVTGAEEGEGAARKVRASTTVWVDFDAGGSRLKGLLYDVDIRDDGIWVYLDKDHPSVKEARQRRSPVQEMLLQHLVVSAVSAALVDSPLLRKALGGVPHLLREIEDEDSPFKKQARLTSHLLKNSRVA